MISLQTGIIVFGVREMLRFGREYTEGNHIETKTAVLVRILISYSQVFVLIIGINIDWPPIMDNVLSYTGSLASAGGQVFTVDCFFAIGKNAFGAEIIFLKALFTIFTPFCYIFMGIIFWLVYFKVKKRNIKGNKDLINKIVTTIIIICFEQQPEVLKSAFSLFDCVNLYREDHPLRFLQNSYDVQCWQGQHLFWLLVLALPTLLLWIIILPGSIVYILRKNRNKLDDPEIIHKYSFIYNGYQQNKYYWEAIIMLRKLMFITNSVFSGSVNLEIYLCLMLVIISFVIHQYCRPYTLESLNDLERVSIFSLGVVSFCALYFQTASAGTVVDVFMIVFGISGNLYFIFIFSKTFFSLQIEKLKQNKSVMKVITYIEKNFCYCFKSTKVQKALFRARTNIRKITYSLRFKGSNRSETSKIDPNSSYLSSPKSRKLMLSMSQDPILQFPLGSPLGSPLESPTGSPRADEIKLSSLRDPNRSSIEMSNINLAMLSPVSLEKSQSDPINKKIQLKSPEIGAFENSSKSTKSVHFNFDEDQSPERSSLSFSQYGSYNGKGVSIDDDLDIDNKSNQAEEPRSRYSIDRHLGHKKSIFAKRSRFGSEDRTLQHNNNA